MTAQGTPVLVMGEDREVFVPGALVIQADIEADNRVIHVIDAVMISS